MSGGGMPFGGGFGVVGGAGGGGGVGGVGGSGGPPPGGGTPMRTGFTPTPQQAGMSPQLPGMMNGQMPTSNNMVGMGTQMGQPYSQNMQNPLGNMSSMPNQGMAVSNSTPSPNQGMGNMNMGTSIGTNTNMSNGVNVPAMGSAMAGGNMGMNMGISAPGIANNAMAANAAMPNNPMSNGIIGTTPNMPINQSNAAMTTSVPIPSQPQQNKEFNTASLCRFGQETVQDIVSRTQEVFQTLKAIQPPNGTVQSLNSSNEKKGKIQEQIRTIRLLFKRLRLIYEKCNENCQVPGMEYTHIESLIPLKEEYEHKTIDEKKTSEAYKIVCEENKELTEQVVLKNKQLKEVITHLRTIIWEINAMLTMRKS